MMPPRPTALRLVTRATAARVPVPPLGLSTWTSDAQAIAILLDMAGLDGDDPAAVAAQIPCAADLPERTLVFVLEAPAGGRGVMHLLRRSIRISRAARCTALVARGFVGVGAGTDEDRGADLAWGLSSPC
jgi:hypothetical protein